MSVTPEIEAEILRAHAANPKRFSPFKVAKQVGATTAEVIQTVKRHQTAPASYTGGVRRVDLEPYIVATRRVMAAGWDNDDPAIIDAREKYCAGTHDMATHRDGDWLHLCLFPLVQRREAQPNYFNAGAV